jgi:hypothetical protein
MPFEVEDYEAGKIPLALHTLNLLTQWQAEAPEEVTYALMAKDRFEIVKKKYHRLKAAEVIQGLIESEGLGV